MEVFRIVGLSLVGAILLVIIRQQRPEIATQLSLAVGVVIFLLLADKLMAVIGVLETLATRANVNFLYLSTVLKIIGIAYVAEFGAQVCRDAGESALAGKVELAGKILILVLAVPVVGAVLEVILQLLPGG